MSEQNELPTLQQLMTETPPDQSPKKRRGRPPKTENPQSVTGSSASGGSSAKVQKELDLIKKTFDTIFVGSGSLLSALDQFDGAVLIHGGPSVSDALAETARNDARLREALVNFCNASGYAQLVSAVVGLLLPIAAHHNLAPRMFVLMAPEKAVDIHMEQERKNYEEMGALNGNGVHV